jgi:hypothetical protein
MLAGTRKGGDADFVKWYLGVIHHATPIERLIFMTPAKSGDYKAAKKWACQNQIDHVEYPQPDVMFVEKYEKEEIDLCLCFRASYRNGTTSSRIRNIAMDKEMSILEAPQQEGK